MVRINKKALESKYNEAQGKLDTRLSKGGLKVSTRQIAKVLACKLGYLGGDIERNLEPKLVKKAILASDGTYAGYEQYLIHNKPKKLKDSQFKLNVDWLVQEIESLPQEVKTSLACAYVFSSRVPRPEREDILQELTANLLQYIKVKGRDSFTEERAYLIAKRDTIDFWRKLKLHSQGNESIEAIASSQDNEVKDITTLPRLPQEQYNECINALCYAMDFNLETRETLKVEKLVQDSKVTQYASETMRRNSARELYNHLRDSTEYDCQAIGKCDFKSTLSQLPPRVRKIIMRVKDSGEVKITHALGEADIRFIERWVKGNSKLASQVQEDLRYIVLASGRS